MPVAVGIVIAIIICLAFFVSSAFSRSERNPSIRPDGPSSIAQPSDQVTAQLRKPLKGFPDVIAFLDVETTGLMARDRIVTLAVVLVNTEEVQTGKLNLNFIHRIYNPGIKCHPDAERIHGYEDWILRHQGFFSEEADEVRDFLARAGLICCHNAEFDMRFVNAELESAGLPPIKTRTYCTMKTYRSRYVGSASLANICAQLGLSRKTNKHGALEDAFLTADVFFALNHLPVMISGAQLNADQVRFQNFRTVPPPPDGLLPPRKRRPKAGRGSSVQSTG